MLQLFGCERLGLQVSDLLFQKIDRLDRRLTLRTHESIKEHRTIPSGAEAPAYAIGEAGFRADFVHQTAGEAAAENRIHDFDGVVVGIAAQQGRRMDSGDVRLRHVLFADEVHARLCLRVDRRRGRSTLAARPGFKRGVQLLLHRRAVEITDDAEDDVVGLNEAIMKRDQILVRDVVEGRVFCCAGVR